MRIYRHPILLLLLCVSCFARFAQGEVVAPDPPRDRPVVIVIMTGTEAPLRDRDIQFVTALGLSLDAFAIKRIESGVDDFLTLTLPDRLERIRPFVETFKAVAAIWLEDTKADTTLLHLVALSTGRALVRIVATQTGPNTESELALAAQELLGEAYLFEPELSDEAVEEVVSKVQKVVIEKKSQAPTAHRKPSWHFKLAHSFQVTGAASGGEGKYRLNGGSVGPEVEFSDHWLIRLDFSFLFFPQQALPDGLLAGWAFEPALTIGYSWKPGNFSIGPMVGFSARHSIFDLKLGQGATQQTNWWDPRAFAGIDFRMNINRIFSILIGPTVGLRLNQKKITRLSDSSVVLLTPKVDWSVLAGFIFTII